MMFFNVDSFVYFGEFPAGSGGWEAANTKEQAAGAVSTAPLRCLC